MEGTFAGAFLIGTNRGRSSRRLSNIGSSAATLNISPFRVKLHALFQSLPLSLSSYAILFIASRLPPFTRSFGKTVRETMAAIRLCSLFIPTALCFFRTRSSSLELSEKRVARSRRKDLAIPTVLIPHRSRKFRLIRATRVAVFP